VEGAKLDGAKKKSVTQYVLDFTKCSLCGSCVEACRDGAIRYSHEYNLASTNKEDYIMDLFKRLEDERLAAEARGEIVPTPAQLVAQASSPAGSPGVPPGVAPTPATTLKPLPAEAPKPDQSQPTPPAAPK
jgi:ferredoxin